MPEAKSQFEKRNEKSQIKLVITFYWNYSPREVPHPDNYLWGISYDYLPGLLQTTKFMSYYIRKCLKLYVSQARELSPNLLSTVNVSS